MLFSWIKTVLAGEPETRASASDELKLLLRKTMPEASEQEATIVASLAGLLANVAYADRKYELAEHDAITLALSRVQDLPAHAGDAVVQLAQDYQAAQSKYRDRLSGLR